MPKILHGPLQYYSVVLFPWPSPVLDKGDVSKHFCVVSMDNAELLYQDLFDEYLIVYRRLLAQVRKYQYKVYDPVALANADWELYQFQLDIGNSMYTDLEKYMVNRKSRVIRLRKRIKLLLNRGDCYFVTLTFDDDHLNKGYKYCRLKVKRWLTQFEDYCGNVDYGLENDRLHFHFVVLGNIVINWDCGFYYCRKIRFDFSSLNRVSNYLDKLAYHGTKVKCRLIVPINKKNNV